MSRQEKTPKKKSKKKSPQKSEESEYPEMDQAEMNRLFQNAIEHAQAELQQKHEERIKALEADREAQIKAVEDRLTKKFDEEVREVQQAFEESRGANPTTKDTTLMRGIMTEAVVAANNASPYPKTLGPWLGCIFHSLIRKLVLSLHCFKFQR